MLQGPFPQESEATTSLFERVGSLWTQAVEIWASGGWAMYVLAVIALVMFGIGMHVWLRLVSTGYAGMREATWRSWLDNPEEREGRLGDLFDFVTSATSIAQMREYFEQAKKTETGPFSRDLRVMKVCVNAAPLVGLLGTVTGMLATFDALANGSGGDQTLAQIAKGISEALVTTETGLVIALPGVFFQYFLMRSFERYRVFLAHLEAVCVQRIHRLDQMHESRTVQRKARLEVARALQRAVAREPVSAPSPS
jgi:biopolymer transport protein ExbB